MDCNEARLLLDARHDRELSAVEALRLEPHLATCAVCRREAQALRAVSEATRSAEYFRAPDALRARLVAALPAIEPAPGPASDDTRTETDSPAPKPPQRNASAAPPREAPPSEAPTDRPPSRPFGWIRGAWGGTRGRAPTVAWPTGIAVAAVALAVSVALVWHRPGGAGAPWVDELVASHVRAQLSGHAIDVISSDQHTVKPWFNGRIDYAPPVEDLAEAGFALIGGRLDYIDHRRVAVLVYRYRKHVVDVYVLPNTDPAARRTPAALASDGYALARWRDHGMTWWAVSDAEPAVLDALRTALVARLGHAQAPSAQ